MSFQPRFENGIYRDCPFCKGKGCMACPGEADKDYKLAFPDGPKPLATFDTADPVDVEKMSKVIGIDSIRKHFGEGGTGMAGLVEALRAEGKLEE